MPLRDRQQAARAIEAFLRALGYEPSNSDELRETGARVADAWCDDLLAGEEIDPTELLRAESFEAPRGAGGVVMLRDVEIATLCPHHLMPALGLAQLAYVPNQRVVGLGTLTRALDACARRLTLQEHLGQSFVDAVMNALQARGAACSLRLRHACLSARGRRSHAWVETLASAGVLSPGAEMYPVLSGWMR
ncbi:MAG: GTP cyclohydrolase I [Myxococcales bacterium]|nr:GTP cyclohydrolase I [Polyangiaceae bacterium]MDW8248216.1 GTP cyclohydrolase I [Myxococcales bacterium]